MSVKSLVKKHVACTDRLDVSEDPFSTNKVCAETPPYPDVAPVIFRNNYDLEGNPAYENDCPLNTSDCIVRICETCRRCFNGEAVRRCRSL